MRLDKFLCEMNIGTRSQVKTYVKQGQVTVNDSVVKSPDIKIDENSDIVMFKGKLLSYQKYYYYMLNKPAGVVSATRDNTADTVVSLLGDAKRDDIFPVGRLDKDTTGLLLLTNDGDLAHMMLSPKKHVDKVYRVSLAHPLNTMDVERLEQGVDIGEESDTLPAKVEIIEDLTILLTIREGKFHQVKRMLQAVDNQVMALERVSFGPLRLDDSLQPGKFRELTEDEVAQCRKCLMK